MEIHPFGNKNFISRKQIVLFFISVSKYRDPEAQRCCKAGIKAYPISETCRDRAQRIPKSQKCVSAFTDCCEFANKLRLEEPNKLLILARMREYESSGCPAAAQQGTERWWNLLTPPWCLSGLFQTGFYQSPKTLVIYPWRGLGEQFSVMFSSLFYSPTFRASRTVNQRVFRENLNAKFESFAQAQSSQWVTPLEGSVGVSHSLSSIISLELLVNKVICQDIGQILTCVNEWGGINTDFRLRVFGHLFSYIRMFFSLLYLCPSDYESVLELDEAQVRSYFPESWLWEVHQLSSRYCFSQINFIERKW